MRPSLLLLVSILAYAQAPNNAPDPAYEPLTKAYQLLQNKQYDEAIRFFRLALMSNPPNGTALFGLAEGYRASGQHAAALRTYRRYVELMPDGPEATQARTHIRALESKGR